MLKLNGNVIIKYQFEFVSYLHNGGKPDPYNFQFTFKKKIETKKHLWKMLHNILESVQNFRLPWLGYHFQYMRNYKIYIDSPRQRYE